MFWTKDKVQNQSNINLIALLLNFSKNDFSRNLYKYEITMLKQEILKRMEGADK